MEHEEMLLFYLRMIFVVVNGIVGIILSIIGPLVFSGIKMWYKSWKKKSKESELREIRTPSELGADCIRHTNQHSQPGRSGMQPIIIKIELVNR
ncbi:UNVERIFIED_ORG: hypothetical protein QFZ59_000103 [Bacillus sp. B2I3]|nr:hypothetical protein [Bacillus sp. B2I3]